MKKLFLLAALGVAGMTSASVTLGNELNNDSKGESLLLISKKSLKKQIRMTIHTTCGTTVTEVVNVPDYFTDSDYIGVASVFNLLNCGDNADSWEITHN